MLKAREQERVKAPEHLSVLASPGRRVMVGAQEFQGLRGRVLLAHDPAKETSLAVTSGESRVQNRVSATPTSVNTNG